MKSGKLLVTNGHVCFLLVVFACSLSDITWAARSSRSRDEMKKSILLAPAFSNNINITSPPSSGSTPPHSIPRNVAKERERMNMANGGVKDPTAVATADQVGSKDSIPQKDQYAGSATASSDATKLAATPNDISKPSDDTHAGTPSRALMYGLLVVLVIAVVLMLIIFKKRK